MGGYFDIDVDTKREQFVAALQCCLENRANQAAANEISAGSCTERLTELTDVFDVVTDMFSADLEAGLENSNPERPWHVLNMNQAIIVTRSHDPKRMESVFEMQTYYPLTNQPTLH